MADLLSTTKALLESERLLVFARTAFILITGYLLARLAAAAAARIFGRSNAQRVMLARRGAYWLVFGLTVVSALNQLGFDLSVLLGAAGILTVAIGFASQTSASNLISGLFLIAERPFVVGDTIIVSDRTGVVVSIDLLSVKLRTFDNLLVRIPNEALLKRELVNLTHFPIRRVDLELSIGYQSDFAKVRALLTRLADQHPLVLEEPAPLLIHRGFGDSAISLSYCVWATRDSFLEVRNAMYERIKVAFDEEGIEIPYPHRTLSAGRNTPPLPIQVIAQPEATRE